MKSSLEFLEKIYSQQCEVNDYIILSVKGKDIPWKDVPIRFNNKISSKLKDFFKNYPVEDYDLYWSPMPYSGSKRRIENALDTKFLVQDIDEHEDPDGIYPKPSYIWESSPNKFQGMWELDRYIKEDEYTPINKALAEYIGCDDCFDYPHVYRIPGTINHKYKNKPGVGEVKATNKIYKPKTLSKIVNAKIKTKPSLEVPVGSSLTERKIYAKYTIPQKIRDLLALEDITGVDRSSTIWYIENTLHEMGMSPGEIIFLIKNSTFNKYKGRKDEDKRLTGDLQKIISGDTNLSNGKDYGEVNSKPLEVTNFEDVMSNPNTFEGWLVKGFWGRRSHGIVAGMPKTFKSTLVHDLVVSVASGEKFLGEYPVLEPGPVIMVQNENADYVMKDRTEKLILHKGVAGKVRIKKKDKVNIEFPNDLPIYFINQQGFALSNKAHRDQLEKMIKDIKPILVVLDPLYLMFDGDLNSAKDLNPVLNWLLYLKNEYKTSVMLIHHYNKGGTGSSSGGSRMMGSIILYGWIESAWYLSKEVDGEEEISIVDNMEDLASVSKEPAVVTMNREFRMTGAYPEIDIHLSMGEMGNPHYEAEVTLAGEKSIEKSGVREALINLLESSTVPLSRMTLSEKLGLPDKRLKVLLDKLVLDKKLITTDRGFTIYKGYGK